MFNGYESEEEYLKSLKQDDHYHFSIPFEYIEKNYGNDNADMATAIMEVDVDWDDIDNGYKITYNCPLEYLIDQSQGNSDIDGFYEYAVEYQVLALLDSMGITAEARFSGTGRY